MTSYGLGDVAPGTLVATPQQHALNRAARSRSRRLSSPQGCTIEIMASNNSQVGKWEVVKKSKKPGTAGSGGKNLGEKKTGRKALSESNMTRTDQFRKFTWLAAREGYVSHRR